MLSWFPLPYPDESLYSLIARYHERSGNYLVCDTIEQLFGDKRQASSTVIPYRLGHMADLTERYGLTFEKLLHEHTLYDFFLLFSKEENREKVAQILKSNIPKSYDTYLGLFDRQGFPQNMRFCPRCKEEEREKYGESYWHNLHQAPGMLCCTKHECRLIDGPVMMATHGTRNYVSLESVGIFEIPKQRGLSAKEIAVSQDLEELWNTRGRTRAVWEKHHCSFADCFLKLASGKGLATKGGTLRSELLIEAINNRFGQGLLEQLGVSFENSQRPWPITLCRHGKQATRAIKYVLMAEVLCGSWAAFLNYAEEENQGTDWQRRAYSQEYSLEKLEKYRNKWKNVLNDNPNATRNQLIQKASSVHLWLKRHDKNWLLEHLPEAQNRGGNIASFDWEEKDRVCVEKIKSLQRQWAAEKGKPLRITYARFFYALQIIHPNLKKMPKSAELLQQCVESDRQWDIRRLRWAINEITKSGEALVVWKVIRKAGICDRRRKECEALLKSMNVPITEMEDNHEEEIRLGLTR